MDSSKKASSSGGDPNKGKGKGKDSQQQTPSKQSSAGHPKSDKTTSKESPKSPTQGSPSNPPKLKHPPTPSPPPRTRTLTRTQSPTPRTIFTPANNNYPFTGTVTSAVSTPESQKAHLSDDDSPTKRSGDPEAFEEISAWEARGMPGSRKTSVELEREYTGIYQPAVQGPGDEAEFDGDEEE
ncbi:hypothetical protein KC343_g4644 [Hortaea werneckii]|nr:hypothetical protein KC338_g2559 [Hortaea werneckii]KAI7157588.1 hypothetical protein KC352_g27358 [Hortaea werneckii]KAI7568863.1 hypothetical protein KC317_g3813 [Hortaea werneckii]KAI7618250.1 hypothetical protein KC346_g5103 [Hortaea werneckii]KAI7630401.1 hypothetical protein KC343_g4644 [Hortaea werneckii]